MLKKIQLLFSSKPYFAFLIFLVVFCQKATSQLCAGSLGDPVVHITFGADGDAVGPLRPGVTNMTYVTGCPNDGEYTITSLPLSCFGNSWHMLASDHTHDPGGRYMLVNASFQPSDFYVDTVKGLCNNTTYEFATWVTNVLRPSACSGAGIKPNLTFSIETTGGGILQQVNSGDIDPDQSQTWKQYGTFFRTPADVTSVVIRLTNNARGGCGNDLALDDITFRPCGPKIQAFVNNQVSGEVDFCQSDKQDVSFTASFSSGFSDPVLQWQLSVDTGRTWTDIPGAQNFTYTRKPSSPGWYQYRVVIAERTSIGSPACRVASNVTNIVVHPSPQKKSPPFVLGCTGTDLQLEALDGPGLRFQWSGPNGFSDSTRNPVIKNVGFKDSGLYTVLIQTAYGCVATDSFPVRVFPGIKAAVNPPYTICEGTAVSLFASGNGAVSFTWSPGKGLSSTGIFNPVASPVDSTVYQVLVANTYGCQDSALTAVNILKKPIISAGPDKQIFEGDTTILNGTLTGTATGFYWSPSTNMANPNTLTPSVSPSGSITYTLYATSPFGCSTVSDDVFVKVFKKVFVPNSFSPNGDGINDTWQIRGLDSYPSPSLKVFTRYGGLVYEAGQYLSPWDGTYNGKPLATGVYYYLLDLHMNLPLISGWVLIVR